MVKRVVITNYLGESVEYKIEGVDVENNNGLFITEIEGLGPPGANLIFTKLVNVDGSIYNSGKINERNIVIKARFLEARTIEEARLSSYRFFPLKKQLRFDIETDNRKAYIYGYVEKNEPNIFSEASDVQISVICGDPVFLDSNGESNNIFSKWGPLFEFVYSNEGNAAVTEFGNVDVVNGEEKNPLLITDYKGDAEVGYTFTIHALGSYRNPKIYFIDSDQVITFNTYQIETFVGKTISEGDDIILTMLPDKKDCYFVANSGNTRTYTNITRFIDIIDFKWPKLTPGYTNWFSISAEEGSENIQCYISYQAAYEGV